MNLVRKVLKEGYEYEDPNRKGIMRKQIDHAVIEIDNGGSYDFPIITSKLTYPQLALQELFLFLAGESDIREYRIAGINFWDEDLARFNKETERPWKDKYFLTGTYPELMRKWKNHDGVIVDQIEDIMKTLKESPTSTKKTVTMWNPKTKSVLTPCHHMFELLNNPKTNKLSLKWSQHSCDLFLGIPMNIYYYNHLLRMFCEYGDFKVGKLIGNLSNIHLYDNSWMESEEMVRRWRYEKLNPISWGSKGYIKLGKHFYKDTLENCTQFGAIQAPEIKDDLWKIDLFWGLIKGVKLNKKAIPKYNVKMLTYG